MSTSSHITGDRITGHPDAPIGQNAASHSSSSLERPADGTEVFGRYLLLERLSRGGMGELFLAKHGLSGFEKVCVIKKVLPHLNKDERFIARFVDEAQVAIRLQHANIAQVFEVGRVGDEYFLAIEFIEGRDLRRSLNQLDERNRRFSVDMALLIARDMANGLAYAHRRASPDGTPLELVHCDVSPPNVVVSFEGEVKLIDFGIAKSAMRGAITDPKIGFGKFGYMAPEQLIRGGVVDHRTDIYATGSVLYALLTGERLYPHSKSSDYRAMAKKVIRGKHSLPSDLDPALEPYDDLVARAVHPRANQRFQSAAELRDAIQKALVAINPTISSDALGEFMRGLFRSELDHWRRLSARAREADLADWAPLFARQSSSTESFALISSAGAGIAPTHSPLQPAPAGGHVDLSGRGDDNDRPIRPRPESVALAPATRPERGRKGIAIALAAVASIGLFGAIGLVALVGQDSVQAVPAGARAPTDTAPSAPTTAIGQERPREAIGSTSARAGLGDRAGPGHHLDVAARNATRSSEKTEPPSGADDHRAPPATAKNRGDTTRKPPTSRNRAEQLDPPPLRPRKKNQRLSLARTKAQFRKLNADYARFKKSYGRRLDREWSELVTAIQYIGTDPAKLRRVSRQIKQFRGKMRKMRKRSAGR